jgi:DNA-binding GntR family transcriptional regulator
MLKGEATAIAAGKISARQLSNCRALLKKLDVLDQDRRGQFRALNQKLHFAIYEAAQSPLLLSIIESLWLQIGSLLTRIPVSRAVEDSADAHKLLVNALERHDPIAARRALERDLTESTERVLSELADQKAIRE